MRIPDYSYCIFHVLKDGMVLVQGHHPERAYIRAAYETASTTWRESPP